MDCAILCFQFPSGKVYPSSSSFQLESGIPHLISPDLVCCLIYKRTSFSCIDGESRLRRVKVRSDVGMQNCEIYCIFCWWRELLRNHQCCKTRPVVKHFRVWQVDNNFYAKIVVVKGERIVEP